MLWLVLMSETWSAEMQGAGKETHEDVDVSAERRRIEEGGADHDSLCLKKLHKAYETKASCFLHTCALYPPDLVILWLFCTRLWSANTADHYCTL